jgi:hypothetical protein
MYTKQSRWFRFLSSATSYDQDRLAADQQKLRAFYLSNGYADFRVTSAVAELTPDKKDFIITYVVEEGPRYKFGDVKVDSQIRDFDNEKLAQSLPMKKGDWYNAKLIEDSIDSLSQTAGLFGYAFTDVNPEFQRDKDTLTMSITFNIAEAKRTYIERIDINGNTQTQDKVVRREFRVAEATPSTASRSAAARTASTRSAISRKSWRSSRTPDRPPTASSWKPIPRNSRPARSSCRRLFVAGTLHHPGEHHPAQFPRQGPGTARGRELFGLFQVDRAGLHRALCVRQERRWASTCSVATITRSTIWAPPARRPIARCRPASRCARACR